MRRLVPVVLAVSGAVLIALSTGWGTLSNCFVNPAAVSMPDQIAGLKRTRYVTSTQATSEPYWTVYLTIGRYSSVSSVVSPSDFAMLTGCYVESVGR